MPAGARRPDTASRPAHDAPGANTAQSTFCRTPAMILRPGALALTPLLLFLAVFFGAGLYYTAAGEPMGFYQLRAPVAILPALALAAWIARRRGIRPGDTLDRKSTRLNSSHVKISY